MIITGLLAGAGLVYVGARLGRALIPELDARARVDADATEARPPPEREPAGRKAPGALQRTLSRLTGPYRDRLREQQLADITEDGPPVDPDEREAAALDTARQAATGLALVVTGTMLSPIVLAGGVVWLLRPYLAVTRSAISDLRDEGRVGLDMLNLVSVAGVFAGGLFVWGAVALSFGTTVRWMVTKAHTRTRADLLDVFGGLPRTAIRVDGDQRIEVPLEALERGQLVEVRAGGVIPVDGLVASGTGLVDQSMLTGESEPFEVEEGQRVLASTVVLSGSLQISVEEAGAETVAAGIAELLRQTTTASTAARPWIEQFEEVTTLPLLGAAALALPAFGLSRALALLWYAPGYRMAALGPMNTLNHLFIASRKGMLVKQGSALDALAEIDTVLFDKTGTLTVGQPEVRRIALFGDFDRQDVLRWVLSAEGDQSHPIAAAIRAAARAEGAEPVPVDDIAIELGMGISAHVEGRHITIGSARYMARRGVDLPDAARRVEREAAARGSGFVLAAVDDAIAAAFVLEARLRPGVEEAIESLRRAGKTVAIVSGDRREPTARLAEQLEVDTFFAETLPDEKAAIVSRLQAEGRRVCFVGDGINDAVALATADVSVSLQGATTAAVDTAEIIILDGRIERIVELFELGEQYDRIVRVSLLGTIVPNAVGIATVLFLGSGFPAAVVVNAMLWVPQLGYVVRPLFTIGDDEPRAQVHDRRLDEGGLA